MTEPQQSASTERASRRWLVNLLVIMSGTLVGLGIFVAVSQSSCRPRPRLDAALARIGGIAQDSGDPVSIRSLGRRLGTLPWLPVPAADLALLGQDASSG